MKVTIKGKEKSQLLGRTRVLGGLEFEGVTPSNVQLAQSLAKEFNVDVNQVVVKNIYNIFSQQAADFLAFVYDSKEAKENTEKITKHQKKQMEEAAKEAAEEKKVEEAKKAEENKEAEKVKKAEENKEE